MTQRILLIEDDQFIRDMYHEELTRLNFEVDSVATGKEGLDKLSQNQYDLILLDIMLPDTNGLEILKQVRQNPVTRDIKVVLLTNLGQEEIIKQGFELGADKYLVKMSYNPEQVATEVKSFLEEKV